MQSRSLHPTDAEHKGFGHSPTSILQRKKCFCIDENIACGCYEASQDAFQIWKSFCDQDRPFSSFTWCGRLFFAQEVFEFAIAASRASRYHLASFEPDFLQIQLQNTCWASPKPDIPHKIAPATRFRWYRISKFSWRKICSIKIGVDSFNIASNRNYYFRFWRQKAEVSLPKKSSNFMVCSIQSRSQEPDFPSPVFSLKTGPDTS